MKHLVDVHIPRYDHEDPTHKYYIPMSDEDLKIQWDNSHTLHWLALSDKGKDKYSKLWDTRYYNYRLTILSKKDIKKIVNKLEEKVNHYKSELDVIHKYLNECK